jgi:hypothetical protein
MPECNVNFIQFLANETPYYEKQILESIRPHDSTWIGKVSTGVWRAGTQTTHTQDRFEVVYPDITQEWTSPDDANCTGSPCDPDVHVIGYGSTRRTFGQLRQSWESTLICYDQVIPISLAKENYAQFINNILKPATNTITSWFLKKQALYWAGKKWVANAQMTEFSYIWQAVGTQELYLLTSVKPDSLLTPQMLQRRVNRLMKVGYWGSDPYADKGELPLIELIASIDDAWQLDHLGGTQAYGGGTTPTVANNWRFQEWGAGSKFWRYGFSGQIGNFAVSVDNEQMRFYYVGASGNATYPHKFLLIPPFINQASSGAGGEPGLKSEPNPYWETAPYRISFIHHRKAMELQTAEAPNINSEMPFKARNLAGKWQFVMNNLTCKDGSTVRPVDNSRMNKGKFIADFWLAIKPMYNEFEEAIFHMGAPQCVVSIAPCTVDNSYPTQTITSANTTC